MWKLEKSEPKAFSGFLKLIVKVNSLRDLNFWRFTWTSNGYNFVCPLRYSPPSAWVAKFTRWRPDKRQLLLAKVILLIIHGAALIHRKWNGEIEKHSKNANKKIRALVRHAFVRITQNDLFFITTHAPAMLCHIHSILLSVHSSIYSFIHSFIHSSIHSFIHSYIR